MGRLNTYSVKVTCPIDGKRRTYYFTAIIDENGAARFGARHGCNDKTGDNACINCWRKVRTDVYYGNKKRQAND